MIYEWVCAKCEKLTDVKRSAKNIDIPPKECKHCGHKKFIRRAIQLKKKVKGFILLGDSGWHDCEYSKYRSIK